MDVIMHEALCAVRSLANGKVGQCSKTLQCRHNWMLLCSIHMTLQHAAIHPACTWRCHTIKDRPV